MNNLTPSYCLCATPYGTVALQWAVEAGQTWIMGVVLPAGQSAEEQLRTALPESRQATCQEIDTLARLLLAVMAGEERYFPLDMVRLDRGTSFQQRVLAAQYAVPRGRVTTYQGLARQIGVGRGARAVGNVLAMNPFPLIIPCHRTIRADGSLGGFGGGRPMKEALLTMEGVSIDARGRVMAEHIM